MPGRNKRAVSAECKEEMPRLWADHQARLSRSRTDPAGHEHVTDIFIHSSSSSSATHSAIGVTKQPGLRAQAVGVSPLGIVLPSDGVLRCWVFGICRVAPLCGVCPTSEPARISMG